jgi:GT2 family glycosyltransferase
MPIDYGTLAAGNLAFSLVVFASAAAMQLGGRRLAKFPDLAQILAVLAVYGAAAAVTLGVFGLRWPLLIASLAGLFLAAAGRMLKGLSFPGNFVMMAQTQFYLACLFWGLCLIATAAVDPLTRGLMSAVFLLASLYFTIALIERLEQMEVICRHDWRWLRPPAAVAARSHYPKVSIHVPTYSEPPDMVMATLDTLAALDYPDYEVLVVDNNTRDPALWRPVQQHCRELGARFRFFHVDRLPGAKAGALNLALRHTAPEAELISIVDSDYKVRPDFIASIVGYFDDPAMGFVQTPQGYRGWERYPYLRMCNWEYSLYLVSTLISRNERMAAITLGTMGLIRRKVLDDIGGWAEWCVTEDSELALRIHAHGYKSTYVNTAYGWGLIPESFYGYKRQRFRWCYGAIQELRRHFRLLLPRPFAKTSPLGAAQKMFHLMHALDTVKSAMEFLMPIFGAMLAAVMLLHGETIPVPSYVWPIFAVAAGLAFSLKLHIFRTLGWSLADTLGAAAAHAALEHTIAMAGIAGLVTRNTQWRRTDKFRAAPSGLKALGTVVPELLLGIILVGASIGLFAAGEARGLLVLLLVGGLLKGIKYLLAPLLVVLSEYGIHERADGALPAPQSAP